MGGLRRVAEAIGAFLPTPLDGIFLLDRNGPLTEFFYVKDTKEASKAKRKKFYRIIHFMDPLHSFWECVVTGGVGTTDLQINDKIEFIRTELPNYDWDIICFDISKDGATPFYRKGNEEWDEGYVRMRGGWDAQVAESSWTFPLEKFGDCRLSRAWLLPRYIILSTILIREDLSPPYWLRKRWFTIKQGAENDQPPTTEDEDYETQEVKEKHLLGLWKQFPSLAVHLTNALYKNLFDSKHANTSTPSANSLVGGAFGDANAQNALSGNPAVQSASVSQYMNMYNPQAAASLMYGYQFLPYQYPNLANNMMLAMQQQQQAQNARTAMALHPGLQMSPQQAQIYAQQQMQLHLLQQQAQTQGLLPPPQNNAPVAPRPPTTQPTTPAPPATPKGANNAAAASILTKSAAEQMFDDAELLASVSKRVKINDPNSSASTAVPVAPASATQPTIPTTTASILPATLPAQSSPKSTPPAALPLADPSSPLKGVVSPIAMLASAAAKVPNVIRPSYEQLQAENLALNGEVKRLILDLQIKDRQIAGLKAFSRFAIEQNSVKRRKKRKRQDITQTDVSSPISAKTNNADGRPIKSSVHAHVE